jgi:hypothetical protein
VHSKRLSVYGLFSLLAPGQLLVPVNAFWILVAIILVKAKKNNQLKKFLSSSTGQIRWPEVK